MILQAEYIWLDGDKPSQQLRSKTRMIDVKEKTSLESFPQWSFDGSSTYQSEGGNSDLVLKPVSFCNDPIRGENNYLVLCEVFNYDETPHWSNKRSLLREIVKECDVDAWLGFEQEYTLFSGHNPLGWPENGYPKPQGPFYCGVGNDKVFGRNVAEAHAELCLRAGLPIFGINAEVMPGQWEFQIGYRGFSGESFSAVDYCDHHWLARWILCRVAEDFDVTVSFDNKPVKGDWNGAGCHTNFSTAAMRDKKSGFKAIEEAISRLAGKHQQHIKLYGDGLTDRLTGEHETCPIDVFKFGIAHRGASIRIPHQVKLNGYGYFEDRRPGANCDPYLVAARLLATICDFDERTFDMLLKQKANTFSVEAVA